MTPGCEHPHQHLLCCTVRRDLTFTQPLHLTQCQVEFFHVCAMQNFLVRVQVCKLFCTRAIIWHPLHELVHWRRGDETSRQSGQTKRAERGSRRARQQILKRQDPVSCWINPYFCTPSHQQYKGLTGVKLSRLSVAKALFTVSLVFVGTKLKQDVWAQVKSPEEVSHSILVAAP